MPNWIKGSFTEVRLRFERKTQVFNQISAGSPRFLGGFAPAIAGLAFLIGLSMLALPTAPPHASGTSSFSEKDPGQEEAMPPLQGAKARSYLQQRGDYDSLMHALTATRFGLRPYDRSPFGSDRPGYLGMSHVQNLNAWFDDQGVTIRPTMSDKDRDKAWRLGLKLKAYGYGQELTQAPAIVSQEVKENRIEYQRCRLPIGTNRGCGRTREFDSKLIDIPIGNWQSAIGNGRVVREPRRRDRAGLHSQCATRSCLPSGGRAAAPVGET